MKLIYFICLSIIFQISVNAQSSKVYIGYIDKEISLEMASYVRRVISEAQDADAKAVIFRINTFGGRVDAATQIKDALISSDILTIAFIDHRAISAGSYIALSCKKIAMVPGSSIGAATVVDQAGHKMSEKYQSFMRSEMRSVAETNGRREDIAQGMVDERIVIPGLVDSTELVTLTTDEALKYHIADTVVNNLNGVLKAFNLKNVSLVKVEPNWAEDVVGFLHNPIVTALLLMIGFVGMFIEVKSPGWGVPGTLGVLALLLFFGSSYILNIASGIAIILFIIGLILLALEIFVIPGFGITGILGIILVFTSLFLALIGNPPVMDFNKISIAIIQLTAALLVSIVLMFLLAKFLPKSQRFKRMILSEEEKSEHGFVSYPSAKELVGSEGIALTTLRPAGSADFNGNRVDVVADWEYIEKGSRVKVLRVEGVKVVVKKVKDTK